MQVHVPRRRRGARGARRSRIRGGSGDGHERHVHQARGARRRTRDVVRAAAAVRPQLGCTACATSAGGAAAERDDAPDTSRAVAGSANEATVSYIPDRDVRREMFALLRNAVRLRDRQTRHATHPRITTGSTTASAIMLALIPRCFPATAWSPAGDVAVGTEPGSAELPRYVDETGAGAEAPLESDEAAGPEACELPEAPPSAAAALTGAALPSAPVVEGAGNVGAVDDAGENADAVLPLEGGPELRAALCPAGADDSRYTR